MIKISHRGNVSGPNLKRENSPEYLYEAIKHGFDVEVDVWYVNKSFYLGHDHPQYLVEDSFIFNIFDHAWFHCKNIHALHVFLNKLPGARFFWHKDDDYTLTSNGYIWTYPGKTITNKTIIVDLSGSRKVTGAYGVCSDFLL